MNRILRIWNKPRAVVGHRVAIAIAVVDVLATWHVWTMDRWQNRRVIDSRSVAVVETEYRCFVLREEYPSGLRGLEVPSNSLVRFETTDDQHEVWVLTGSQWGPFEITVEQHDGPPAMVDDDWLDMVELSLTCQGEVTVCEMIDGPMATLVDRAGDFRVRVCARGRREGLLRDDDPDWDLGDGPVVEHYLLQVWREPASDGRVLREDKGLWEALGDSDEAGASEGDAIVDAGLEASSRILADVEGGPSARRLSGRRGHVVATGEVPASRRIIFPRAASLVAWPSCRGGSAGDLAVGATWTHDGTRPDGDGEYGHITTTFEMLNEPEAIFKTWNWQRPQSAQPNVDTVRSLLDPPSIIRMALMEYNDDSGDKLTTIHVQHVGVPVEWVDDLWALWRWDLHRLTR
ncbi:hypothetical protein [Nocardioides panaciterrulae]|uniref:Uncharacterized protein n=1 Tax=Nocardioides panaciterrulae TaxID=661492 RepID=A0A7Y9JCJ6_9ACTN|nr:hypothetical protein [Nocardioides panaciterrulae]NYD43341.1 hypothetical protein [Nocardioides panaciterrulae]